MLTSIWHVLGLVLSIGFVFLFYHIIKVLIQLSQLLKTMENSVQSIQDEVTPIIGNIEGITGNIEGMSDKAGEIVNDFQDNTKGTMNVLKHAFFLLFNHFFRYLNALKKGMSVGVKHYQEISFPEKEEKSESKKIGIVDHLS